MMAATPDTDFPCSLTVDVPFPTPRLVSIALRALQVDKELSPLVRRTFSVAAQKESSIEEDAQGNILRTEYRATTNRMLRVAVNAFMDSLSLVIQVMEELDEDVLAAKGNNL
ncbi:hypothetical protein DL765_000301 [Monosporascus sp. GIB2]|nr:hypothetical protein DL765_000301 [Monosporascus sp. GIB2]